LKIGSLESEQIIIGFLELKIGSLESEKIIIGFLESEKIGSLQVHTGLLTFSLKKTELVQSKYFYSCFLTSSTACKFALELGASGWRDTSMLVTRGVALRCSFHHFPWPYNWSASEER